jgi:hypothetical protein
LGRDGLCAGKTGCETEQANAEVDKIVMYVQTQLDGTEVAKAGESCNRDNRINRPKKSSQTAAVRQRVFRARPRERLRR